MGIALAGSLILHAVCALLIPPLSNSPSLEPIETVSFARVRRVAITRHDVAARRAMARPTRVARITLAQKQPSPVRQQQAPQAVAQRPAAVAMSQAQRGNPSPHDAVGSVAQSSPMPQATAPATIRQETTPDSQTVAGGFMPFGADEPDPVLDPKALKQLQALGVHVTLIVTVGDDGKTKYVAFHPPLDPQVEAQMRALLVAANWDPAYCGGGIPCQKDANITL
jgi:hypothetical protein